MGMDFRDSFTLSFVTLPIIPLYIHPFGMYNEKISIYSDCKIILHAISSFPGNQFQCLGMGSLLHLAVFATVSHKLASTTF